jgi:transcriptional regulator GlxA family with amidase domain
VDGKPVRTVSDLTVTPGHGPEVLAEADTVIIPGYAITQASAAATDSKALDALSSVRPGTRLVSICSGAFLLAGAGLLDGRRATTHWALSDHFRELFPGSSADIRIGYARCSTLGQELDTPCCAAARAASPSSRFSPT